MSTLSKSYLRSQLSVNNSTLNQQYGLIIYPPKLEFLNVLQNKSSISVISIQNVSKTLKKIRIIGVKEKHKRLFTVHKGTAYNNLAAGCSIDIPITFLSKEALSQSIYTELRIGIKDRMVDGQINIETIAKIPSSNIEFKSILEFDTMVPKQSITKQLLLRNIGEKPGHYKCEIPTQHQSQISIEPNVEGELDTNKSSNLKIKLTAPNKLGIYRCSINIMIDKDPNNMKILEIICNICQHKVNFLMPKTKSNIEQINFGHLYFGQRRSFKGLLINNGPKSAHYSLYLKPDTNERKTDEDDDVINTHYATKDNDENQANIQDRKKKNDDDAFDEDLVPIKIDHEEGTLAPYETKIITICYIPEIKEKLKGFTTTYDPKYDITKMKLLLIIECTQTMKIPLRGISFPVLYHLSQKAFDFGECPVYDRRDLYFELKNENKVMSLKYKFNKIACFNTSPSMGTLLPLQSVHILLTFLPKQLGNFKNVSMKLIFNDNIQTVEYLTLHGSSNQYLELKSRNHFGTELVGGTNKLPIDFKPSIKIINENDGGALKEITAIMKETSNLQFKTELPKEKSAYYKPNWNSSTCTKSLYPSKVGETISIIHASHPDNREPNLVYTYTNMDMVKKYTNKGRSNEYLVDMRKKRKYFKKLSKRSTDGNTVSEAKEDEEPESNIERDIVDIGLNTFYGLNEPNLDLPQCEDRNTLYLGDGQIITTMSDRLNFFKKCMITKYNKKGSITKMDENKLIKNKFKSVPETSAEIIDSQTTLTRKELKELEFGPKCMDFGKICIHSFGAKNFSIINTLKKTILVAVKISGDKERLIKTNPISQVIPPQQMAGFDIIFNAINVQLFDEDITLLINGIHTISFKLIAEVICMNLNLSTNKLLFEFPSIDYLDFNLVKTITLRNTLRAATKYRFDTNCINKDLRIKPCSGNIEANKSETIQFIWSPTTLRPNNKSHETDHIKLQIIDGFDKIIEIETVLPLSKCTLSAKCIRFNTIPIGTEHTKRVHIKNTGHIQSIFRIIRLPPNLSIHPLFGKIDIGTSISLSVTYLSLNPQTFNDNIIIEVRGGKTLKLNVIAKTIIPQINITQNEFDFNGVTIGDNKSLPIELMNTSSVSAHVFLEMTANDVYPNGTFDILYPNEWSDLATEPSKAPIIPLPPIEEDELHSFIASNKSQKSSHKSISSRRSLMRGTSRHSRVRECIKPCNYVCIVRSLENPNLLNETKQQHSSQSSLNDNKPKLSIDVTTTNKSKKGLNSPMMRRGSLLAMGQHLTMMKEAEEHIQHSDDASKQKESDDIDANDDEKDNIRYRILVEANSTLRFKITFHPKEIGEFDFDLNITMAGVTAQDEHSVLLRKCVFGRGLKPRIALSTRNVSFFDVTVLSETKATQQPYEKHIMLTNEENDTIEWNFGVPDLPWKIVPSHGVLSALDTAKIAIYFSPSSDALFRANVDLLLSGCADVYLSIALEGQASYPKLSFKESFLLLPTVALNCRSTKICLIRNHGYENLEIQYEIIDDRAASFINLRFPNGRIIGGNGPDEVKVEISLLSQTAVAFTTRIDFIDTGSNRFSIFVSGMADNCTLSNQPFLYNNDYVIGRGVDHNDAESVVSKLKVLKKKSNYISDNLIPNDIPTNILCDVSVLIRYLDANCYMKFDSNIDNFPADLVSSNGQMVIDLVEFLSGKKIVGLKLKNKNNTREPSIERLIHDYAQLMNFLKAHGALIAVRPEYLLSCAQYIQFIQISSTMSSKPPSSTKHKFNELKSSKSQSDMQKLKKQSEMMHPMISYVAWTQLLFQIVKLFILNTITLQAFVKQSDIAGLNKLILSQTRNDITHVDDVDTDDAYDDDDDDNDVVPLNELKWNEEKLSVSNVYSVYENILLMWVSLHYNKMCSLKRSKKKKKFFENFSALSDGIGITYLLQSYAPHMTELEGIRIRTPLNDTDKHSNASLILQCMKKMGLNIAITCDDITAPIERNLCLFILYLYQHLPHFAENNEKNIITFNGNLNEEIIRKIHISNPSKTSKICYEIIMEGDASFELKTSSFIALAPFGKKVTANGSNSRLSSARTECTSLLGPGQLLSPQADVIISYTPRFIRPAFSRLTLLAKPFPDAIFPCKVPETMSFELKSSIIESKAMKTIECKGRLYESTKIEFQVNNPYSEDCEFNIIIKNISDYELIPSPWHCDRKSIKIGAKETVSLSMQYLPFNMSKHVCFITFMDSRYGEFLYNIIGESLLPSSMEDIALKCRDTESICHEINFNKLFENPLLLKARHIAADRMHKQSAKQSAKQEIQKISLQSNPCIYNVDVSSPFYVTPKQLKLYDDADADNRLSITFNARGPGSYPCRIKLESHFAEGEDGTFNIGDIRIYNICVTAQSQGTHAELEFNAHANERVIQKIPIVNSTTSDWRISTQIIGDAAHDFSTEKQREFSVKSGTTGYYHLIYAPQWISCNVCAQLIIDNHATEEKYVYDLNCTSLEPLSKDHIVLQCQAKSSVEHEFSILNPYYPKQSVEYCIESDLPGIRGDADIRIEAAVESAKYKLWITPQCGGNIHGSVSFIEKNKKKKKKFVWFAVELVCTSPEPEKIIKISAYLREVVAVEINLSNPLDRVIEFSVAICGEGLFGDNRLILSPKQSSCVYTLHYSPLITGQVKGSISFSNEVSGEFWYSLILIGKQPPSIQLTDMICTVGNVCYQEISVENPFNDSITLKKDENIIINNASFYLKQNNITIAASCIHPICLVYRPSAIGIKQSCDIILKHSKLGEWNYNVFGLGKEPHIEKHTFIYALLHSRISKVISFQNPFDEILKIKIELESNCAIFQLFMKKKKGVNTLHITPNSSLQIPIFFSPNAMKKYCANLVISAQIENKNENKNKKELIWNYPIIGIAEYKCGQLLNIKCNARESFHKIWSVELENYENNENIEDEFSIEIASNPDACAACDDELMKRIISKSLQIDLIKKKLSKNNLNSLQIQTLFEPLRAFNGSSKLHIMNKNGVRWIFQLHFVVNKAEVDDIIKIQSQLHCTNSICFLLQHNEIQNTPFRAYFTADSPFEFDVNPKTGIIQNESKEQQFVISFTPNEYGAALNGTLIIETTNMEWSYRVIGNHPTYIPPNVNKFKPTVDDKISKKIQFQRQKDKTAVKNRNFLKRNISATRKQTK